MQTFRRTSNLKFLLLIFAMALAGIACSLSKATPAPTPTAKPANRVSQTARPTATIEATIIAADTPTAIPADEPTPTQAAPQGVRYEYQGVSFEYPPALFANVNAQIASWETGDPNTPGWPGSVPEHYSFEFDGYPLQDTFHSPHIRIYPIQEYAAVNPPAGDIARELDEILRGISDNNTSLPFLPMWNAGQVFNARSNILPFGSGQGIRYLTCYAQAILPIDNYCLFYTYQGLTNDGKYYVSVIFPVNLPALEQAEVKSKFNQDFEGDEYQAYLSDISSLLNNARAEDFIPNLNELDGLVKSLRVVPSVDLQSPPMPQASCPGAMAIRLQPGVLARVTFTDGIPLRVRRDPGKSGEILAQMPEGTEFTILEGPQCVDQGAWWRMQTNDGNLTGWVLEAEDGIYYVEPI
jgi:hypothetical protein